jgi:glucose dehydrogenase
VYSFAISQGVVYVGSYDGSVYAIAFASGKLLWRYDTKGRALNPEDFGFDRRSILSSPSVTDGVVYIGSRDAHLYAVDAAKGTLRWLRDYEKDNMTWANSSPAVRDGVVYTGTSYGGFVHALRTADGHELWRFKMPSRVWASPAIAGSNLYITNQSGDLYAVDAVTGKETWHVQPERARCARRGAAQKQTVKRPSSLCP